MCDGRLWCGSKADFIAAAEPAPKWAGVGFETGRIREPVAGVYVFGRLDGERVYAVYVGEAEDIVQALAAHADEGGPAGPGADRFYWTRQDDARLRAVIVHAIVGRYRPPGNFAPPPKTDNASRIAEWDGAERLGPATSARYQ